MKTIMDVMNSSIENLDLSVRCSNCMRRAEIHTLRDLTRMDEEAFLKMKNFGKKSQEELVTKVKDMGLAFGMTDRDWVQWGLMNLAWIKTTNWMK
ncbi:MAG: hypothetical protein KBT11_11225 [Treponema sp.]|nr:hypothetical protein [Candidatus Treponema equifaecale]